MENLPIISILGYNLPPEIQEKYNNWTSEVYSPYLVKTTPLNELDRYQIRRKDPFYPDYGALWHHSNLEDVFTTRDSQFYADLAKDLSITFSKMEWIWRTTYHLMRSFRNLTGNINQEDVTTIEGAPFVLLEAYQFTPEEESKYLEWCVKYGNRIYVPLFMKIPGVTGCNRYRRIESTSWLPAKESNYPSYLQIVCFESENAFENFEKSPELASYKKAMKSDISNNLTPQWYVQYQLIKSYRK